MNWVSLFGLGNDKRPNYHVLIDPSLYHLWTRKKKKKITFFPVPSLNHRFDVSFFTFPFFPVHRLQLSMQRFLTFFPSVTKVDSLKWANYSHGQLSKKRCLMAYQILAPSYWTQQEMWCVLTSLLEEKMYNEYMFVWLKSKNIPKTVFLFTCIVSSSDLRCADEQI